MPSVAAPCGDKLLINSLLTLQLQFRRHIVIGKHMYKQAPDKRCAVVLILGKMTTCVLRNWKAVHLWLYPLMQHCSLYHWAPCDQHATPAFCKSSPDRQRSTKEKLKISGMDRGFQFHATSYMLWEKLSHIGVMSHQHYPHCILLCL